MENENISRFKIVYLDIDSSNPSQKELIREARDRGIIRIITKDDLRNEIGDEEKLEKLIDDIREGKIEEQIEMVGERGNTILRDSDGYTILYNTWLKKFLYEKRPA